MVQVSFCGTVHIFDGQVSMPPAFGGMPVIILSVCVVVRLRDATRSMFAPSRNELAKCNSRLSFHLEVVKLSITTHSTNVVQRVQTIALSVAFPCLFASTCVLRCFLQDPDPQALQNRDP